MSINLENFPEHILVNILKILNVQDLIRFSQTNIYFQKLLEKYLQNFYVIRYLAIELATMNCIVKFYFGNQKEMIAEFETYSKYNKINDTYREGIEYDEGGYHDFIEINMFPFTAIQEYLEYRDGQKNFNVYCSFCGEFIYEECYKCKETKCYKETNEESKKFKVFYYEYEDKKTGVKHYYDEEIYFETLGAS